MLESLQPLLLLLSQTHGEAASVPERLRLAPSSLERVLLVPRPVHRHLHEAAGDDAAGPPAHPVKEVEARGHGDQDSVKATLQGNFEL